MHENGTHIAQHYKKIIRREKIIAVSFGSSNLLDFAHFVLP